MDFPFADVEEGLESASHDLTKAWNRLDAHPDLPPELTAVKDSVAAALQAVGNALSSDALARFASIDRAERDELQDYV